jgi:nitrite reductase/ring-hydroxylating ferredoxin subunit
MGKFIKVATTDEIGEQPVKSVEVDGRKITLFDVQGEIFALSDTCPHRGGPLSEGESEGTTVTCPWHSAQTCGREGSWGRLPRPASRATRLRLRGRIS